MHSLCLHDYEVQNQNTNQISHPLKEKGSHTGKIPPKAAPQHIHPTLNIPANRRLSFQEHVPLNKFCFSVAWQDAKQQHAELTAAQETFPLVPGKGMHRDCHPQHRTMAPTHESVSDSLGKLLFFFFSCRRLAMQANKLFFHLFVCVMGPRWRIRAPSWYAL